SVSEPSLISTRPRRSACSARSASTYQAPEWGTCRCSFVMRWPAMLARKSGKILHLLRQLSNEPVALVLFGARLRAATTAARGALRLLECRLGRAVLDELDLDDPAPVVPVARGAEHVLDDDRADVLRLGLRVPDVERLGFVTLRRTLDERGEGVPRIPILARRQEDLRRKFCEAIAGVDDGRARRRGLCPSSRPTPSASRARGSRQSRASAALRAGSSRWDRRAGSRPSRRLRDGGAHADSRALEDLGHDAPHGFGDAFGVAAF